MRVALFSSRANAEAVRQRLAQAGIPAAIKDSLGLKKLWFVSRPQAGVRIEVPAEQFERAEQFLLDWDAAEGALRQAIRCPECKSLRVEYPQFAQHSLLTNLAMGLVAKVGLIETHYYCEDCHFTWPREGARPRRNRPHMAPYYFIEGVEQTSLNQPAGEQKDSDRKAA
jgi:hypothetical protein